MRLSNRLLRLIIGGDEPRAGGRELKKDLRGLVKEIQANGHTVNQGRGRHPYWVRGRSGRRITLPCTPSDHRSIRNLRTQLIREGVLPRRP